MYNFVYKFIKVFTSFNKGALIISYTHFIHFYKSLKCMKFIFTWDC